MAAKPRVLVLGGLGFVGKHFVDYVVKNDLASKVRVVDKVIVAMARLSKTEEELFSKVECIQANLADPEAAARSFNDPEGDYQIVVNLAGVTKLSQADEVYKQGITQLSVTVAKEALKHKTEKFIEVSTSKGLYKPSSKSLDENADTAPWTGIAKAKLEAEKELKALNGLPLVVLRPALVYGAGDPRSLAARICVAATYKKKAEKMEFPSWFEDQKISVVHVDDVARAIWHVAKNAQPGSVYNLSDKASDFDQKKLNGLLSKVFGIGVGSMDVVTSTALKLMSKEDIVGELNSELGIVWLKLLSEHKVEYSPLSPYLDADVLSSNSFSIDGSAIEKTGFAYEHPTITEDEVRTQVKSYESEGWFPAGLTI